MEPRLTLLVTACASEDGATDIRLSVMIRDREGSVCEAQLPTRLPVPPSFSHPWDWVQSALAAATDACDCLCDVTMTHDVNCQEVNRADA